MSDSKATTPAAPEVERAPDLSRHLLSIAGIHRAAEGRPVE